MSLSSLLLITTLLWVSFVVSSMGYTMSLNWQLEAGANAKTAVMEIRHQTFLAVLSNRSDPSDLAAVKEKTDAIDRIFRKLEGGDPSLPLFVPEIEGIKTCEDSILSAWRNEVKPALLAGAVGNDEVVALLEKIRPFNSELTSFASRIDEHRLHYQGHLKYLQLLLIVLAIGSLFVIMAFLSRFVINPIEGFREGLHQLSSGNLKARVPVYRNDEIGDIARAFNYMADRLSDLYANLEQKVIEKTLTVDEKNRHLAQLYEMTSFFAEKNPREDLSDGFVDRIMRYTDSDACLVELITAESGKSYVEAQRGIEPEVLDEIDEILSGSQDADSASRSFISYVRLIDSPKWAEVMKRAGYSAGFGFQIKGMEDSIGAFYLFFKDSFEMNTQLIQLLENIATNFGGAIEASRLIEMDRQYAVVQERSLLAQGLHDSIAQSLSYLNLQVQFLKNAIADNKEKDRDEALQNIENGVQESYEDVRELLLNFRERLHAESFEDGLKKVLQRFEAQSKVCATLRVSGNGVDLTDRQKLQVIFIVQEALSNVRKHASADHVYVNVENLDYFRVTVTDDGVGLNRELMKEREKNHVGLSIMSERASRIGAELKVEMASPIGGTKVTLFLPEDQRRGHV